MTSSSESTVRARDHVAPILGGMAATTCCEASAIYITPTARHVASARDRLATARETPTVYGRAYPRSD